MAKCPTCQGTGKVVCPNCDGNALVKPTITYSGGTAKIAWGKVYVTSFFQNKEDVGAYGTPIVEVKAETKTYTKSSSRTYFPPHESVTIEITFEGISNRDYDYLSEHQYLGGTFLSGTVTEVDEITCPVCDGTGFVSCPDCGGALIDGEGEDIIIDGGGGEQKGDVSVSLPVDWTMVGVGVVAAVVIAAVVVVRRKKVTEEDLRKLPSDEFQNWVVQRLLGKASSLRDSRIGICGYTAEGHPIQIEQSDNIGGNVIDNFASVMGRIKAKNGIVVAFSFSDDVYRGMVRARRNYGIEIKKVTVKELIKSKKMA